MQSGSRVSSRFVGMCLVAWVVLSARPFLQVPSFSSGSDGSDGAFAASGPPGTVIVFDPAQFHGTNAAANVFNFTTISIPSGVTVRLSGNKMQGPVYWLAQGDVNIAGTLDLSGGKGQNPTANSFTRSLASVPGSGGYVGGIGGNSVQLPLAGSGPGGGARATNFNAFGGTFSGNSVLIPLVGGSGGGGANTGGSSSFDAGGGAGGGAILIASSTQIIVSGSINANGGAAGSCSCVTGAGGGSGGAIRLVANSISGAGSLLANGGVGIVSSGAGRIRLEASAISFVGSIQGSQGTSVPNMLLVPTAGSPSARVVSIGGTPINPNPDTFPDLTINTTSPLDVVIETRNIPTSATISLTVLGEAGTPDTVVTAPQLSNCNSASVCTTTVQVVFQSGASRGLTKVTWTQ